MMSKWQAPAVFTELPVASRFPRKNTSGGTWAVAHLARSDPHIHHL